MKYLNARTFWIVMSGCMSCNSLLMMLSNEVTLNLVAVSFCTMKISEYSLRGVANEMVGQTCMPVFIDSLSCRFLMRMRSLFVL